MVYFICVKTYEKPKPNVSTHIHSYSHARKSVVFYAGINFNRNLIVKIKEPKTLWLCFRFPCLLTNSKEVTRRHRMDEWTENCRNSRQDFRIFLNQYDTKKSENS